MLHSRTCACRGTGRISVPGWAHPVVCVGRGCDVKPVSIPIEDWDRLGRPRVIEDLPAAVVAPQDGAYRRTPGVIVPQGGPASALSFVTQKEDGDEGGCGAEAWARASGED